MSLSSSRMAKLMNATVDSKTVGCVPKRGVGKRRLAGDETVSAAVFPGFRPRISKPVRMKRAKQPFEVHGIKLPLNRIVETLSKPQLQQLILDLVNEYPQITAKVIEKSPIVTVDEAIQALLLKLEKEIIGNLPYKMDPCSDYSFLRVKHFVNDFFQLLSDYTLNYMPPIENDLTIPLGFIKKFLMEVFPMIPNFNAMEFRYFHNVTIEKFNHILENCITQFINEKKQNILLIINEDWLKDFKQINELNGDSFANIITLLSDEINQYYSSGTVILSASSQEESVKLQGIESLLNLTSKSQLNYPSSTN